MPEPTTDTHSDQAGNLAKKMERLKRGWDKFSEWAVKYTSIIPEKLAYIFIIILTTLLLATIALSAPSPVDSDTPNAFAKDYLPGIIKAILAISIMVIYVLIKYQTDKPYSKKYKGFFAYTARLLWYIIMLIALVLNSHQINRILRNAEHDTAISFLLYFLVFLLFYLPFIIFAISHVSRTSTTLQQLLEQRIETRNNIFTQAAVGVAICTITYAHLGAFHTYRSLLYTASASSPKEGTPENYALSNCNISVDAYFDWESCAALINHPFMTPVFSTAIVFGYGLMLGGIAGLILNLDINRINRLIEQESIDSHSSHASHASRGERVRHITIQAPAHTTTNDLLKETNSLLTQLVQSNAAQEARIAQLESDMAEAKKPKTKGFCRAIRSLLRR